MEAGDADVDVGALYSQVTIDKSQLARHIRHAFQERSQVTLRDLIEIQPLRQGLAELVAYLQLGSEMFKTVVDEDTTEIVVWRSIGVDGVISGRRARLPRVIFVR